MTITSEQMTKSLMSPDEAKEILAKTEPLSVYDLESADSAEVSLPGWTSARVATAHENVPMENVLLRFGDTEMEMSRECVLELATNIGLNRTWAKKVPGEVLAPSLNYGLKHFMAKGSRVLAHDDAALAVVEGSIHPYSNVRLLDTVLEQVRSIYGVTDADLFVDKRMTHDLRKSHIRVVVPERVRQIQSSRNGDRVDDEWSTGIQIKNSLIGEDATRIEGYAFAWWCTNGCSTQFFDSEPWTRRGSPTEDATMIWAAHAVDGVLGGMESMLDNIAALTQQPIVGEAAQVLDEIFKKFKVGPTLRKLINDRMAENDDMTLYGVMQAVTSAANGLEVSPSQRLQLTAIGGMLPEIYHSAHTVLELPDLLDKIGETSVLIDGVEHAAVARKVRS